mgnify:CR=1 FL=1
MTEVTGSCAEGDTGYVYSGSVPFEIEEFSIDENEVLNTKIKLNVGFPTKSLADSKLPVDGVGLARIEFILSSELGIHPLAFVHHDDLKKFLETGEVSENLKAYREVLENSDDAEVKTLVESLEKRAWLIPINGAFSSTNSRRELDLFAPHSTLDRCLSGCLISNRMSTESSWVAGFSSLLRKIR